LSLLKNNSNNGDNNNSSNNDNSSYDSRNSNNNDKKSNNNSFGSLLTDKTRAENALFSTEQSLPLNPSSQLQTASQLESDSVQDSTVLVIAKDTF